MLINFFKPEPENLEELKTMYRKLAMANHPDRGGNGEDMKTVNTEYDYLFPIYKSLSKILTKCQKDGIINKKRNGG
jgi:hypothetical protein